MLTLFLAMWATAASACEELTLPDTLILDPEMVDDSPPTRPDVLDVNVDYRLADGGCETPCPDRALLTVYFNPSEDDQTPSDSIGYVVRVLEGELPEGIVLPEDPFLGPTAEFAWAVDREVAIEGFRVVFEVRSVDLAGNVSLGSIEIDIDQPKTILPFSCSQAGGRGSAMVLMGLVALRRRRRPAPIA